MLGGGFVNALASSGSTLYVGGSFTDAGVVGRQRLAAFDLTSGALLPWNPGANDLVLALAAAGSTVYAGGDFTTVNGSLARHGLAAFDGTTGAATSWNPDVAPAAVLALAVTGSTVYAGGGFATVNGGTVARSSIAAFDRATGAATAWIPAFTSEVVDSLALSGATLYFGGALPSETLGARRHPYIAALDADTAATRWYQTANDRVYAVAVSGSTVAAGGAFGSVGGVWRRNLAAVDLATGAVRVSIST